MKTGEEVKKMDDIAALENLIRERKTEEKTAEKVEIKSAKKKSNKCDDPKKFAFICLRYTCSNNIKAIVRINKFNYGHSTQ